MAVILIVDGDPDVIESARPHLEREGHSIQSACNREEGMALAQNGGADLLIFDIMMGEPDDGIAMVQDLRKAGCRKPILLLSNMERVMGQHYAGDGAIASVDDFIEMPVRPEVFLEKVTALLNR